MNAVCVSDGLNVSVELETEAVMRWSRSVPFVFSLHLAAGEVLVEYPYSRQGAGVSTCLFIIDLDIVCCLF